MELDNEDFEYSDVYYDFDDIDVDDGFILDINLLFIMFLLEVDSNGGLIDLYF